MENNRSCSDKSLVSPLFASLHLIRSARRRDSAARGTGRVSLSVIRVEKRGEKTRRVRRVAGRGEEQKSHDCFHEKLRKPRPFRGGFILDFRYNVRFLLEIPFQQKQQNSHLTIASVPSNKNGVRNYHNPAKHTTYYTISKRKQYEKSNQSDYIVIKYEHDRHQNPYA